MSMSSISTIKNILLRGGTILLTTFGGFGLPAMANPPTLFPWSPFPTGEFERLPSGQLDRFCTAAKDSKFINGGNPVPSLGEFTTISK